VSGLSVEVGTEDVPEGGENRFVQKYPTRPKYPDLVLKRGLLTNSQILTWIRKCIEDLEIKPKEVFVKLLDEEHQPLMTWHLVGAFPTKWAVSDFNASNSAVVIESLQMYYRYFTVKLGRG
jgi:phage tail-like protein